MLRLAISFAVLVLSAGAAWAQAEQAAKAADVLMQQGLPGAVIVILGCAIIYLAYALRSSWQARLDDQRGFSEKFVALSNDYNVATHDIAKTTAAQSVAIEGIDAGAKARWVEAKGALDRLDDKLDDKLDPLASGVAANGSALGRMENDIRDIRNHAMGQRPGGGR